MEINVNKQKVCVNKFICEKKELFFVEDDVIVPDTKPDILNTINLNGNICILKKEVEDGFIKLDGGVNSNVIYVPDSKENNLRGLNASINFSKSIDIPECEKNMISVLKYNIKDLECKVLNGRKINIKAGIEVNIKLYLSQDIEYIDKINNIDNLQILNKNLNINSLIGTGSTKIYVKDNINIDKSDNLLEILKSEVNLVNNDTKISYNKVLSKCEIEIKIIYLTKDNKIKTANGLLPAVGFIEMPNISEKCVCNVKNEIKNIVIRPNTGNDNSIYVEAEIESCCFTYEEKQINIIQDLYSPTLNLQISKKRIKAQNGVILKNKNFNIKSKINIEDLQNGNLLDVEILPNILKEQIAETKIIYEGELILNFIFSNENNNINSRNSKIPFEFSIENPISEQNIYIETSKKILNKNFDVKSNGDIECNIEMEFETKIFQNVNIEIIDNIWKEEKNEKLSNDYDSLIIYVTQKNDNLWNIAKKFKSTVDEIAKINGIENNNVNPGDKIFIPKFSD